ncbi:hypothetical protein BYT27DRAFT_7262034 [Phlegmacium glaucopus]|nr:hypothetical protein BYT27DRAFT_7262034 [Phlegmacium glaucopus]
MTRHLVLDDSYLPDEDIGLFLQSKFDEIKWNHPLRNLLPSGWPSDSELVCLVEKSSGQLDIIFGLSNLGVDTPFAELDALYIHIFSKVRDINRALEILSLLVLNKANIPLTPQLLEDIFFLRHGDVYIILSDLHSILWLTGEEQERLKYHNLLSEFLGDPIHSQEVYVDGNKFATLATELAENIFGLIPMVITPCPVDGEDTPDVWGGVKLIDNTEDAFLACALSCLPDCLERASPSKDLVLFLQNHQIHSNWPIQGHSSEVIVAAIHAYILRCNVSEVPDMNLEQSNVTDGLRCNFSEVLDMNLEQSNVTDGLGCMAGIVSLVKQNKSNCIVM